MTFLGVPGRLLAKRSSVRGRSKIAKVRNSRGRSKSAKVPSPPYPKDPRVRTSPYPRPAGPRGRPPNGNACVMAPHMTRDVGEGRNGAERI